MKPSSYTESTRSASTPYAPSVPMSVHRELAAELRANKAVIDSLNNRNEQLLKQNQRLKQEIHQVVQAALSLGQTAGVTRSGTKNSFYKSSRNGRQSDKKEPLNKSNAPLTHSASSGRMHSDESSAKQTGKQISEKQKSIKGSHLLEVIDEATTLYEPSHASAESTASVLTNTLVHKPIGEGQPAGRSGKKHIFKSTNSSSLEPHKTSQPSFQFATIMPKLFTEELGSHRSAFLEKADEQEISGIWLALSILLIVVTAFGAGFLIMKPLLDKR